MEGVTATNGKEKVMFEHKTEEEARKEILSMVEGYYQAFHAKKEDFREGDRISYAARVYDQDEMYNLVDSALEFWLTQADIQNSLKRNLRIILVCVLFACQFRVFGKSAGVYGTDFSTSGRAACEAWG